MMIGPIMKPRTPKAAIPPIVEKKISKECISISFPTSCGRRMLSAAETIPVAISKKTPFQMLPVINIIIEAAKA